MAIINDIMEKAKQDVKKLIEKVQTNDLEQQPGRTIMESFENQVGGVGAGGWSASLEYICWLGGGGAPMMVLVQLHAHPFLS